MLDRRAVLGQGTGLAVTMATGTAKAAGHSQRRVRLLVGFPRGGPIDISARIIADALTQQLGAQFVVENVPGESGNRATRALFAAAPDGATLLMCGPVNVINATLFKDVAFAPAVSPIAGLWRVPLVVEVRPGLKVASIQELVAFAKANRGGVRVGFAGIGTPQHVALALFQQRADVQFTLTPYLGSSPALADLLAGKVDAMFDPLPSSIALVRAGALRPLAVTTPSRCAALPDTPAVAELLPG